MIAKNRETAKDKPRLQCSIGVVDSESCCYYRSGPTEIHGTIHRDDEGDGIREVGAETQIDLDGEIQKHPSKRVEILRAE